MNLPERLTLFITKNFNSKKEFAEFSGIDNNYLSRYVYERFMPSAEILIKLQDSGLSIDWLLKGVGIMYAKNPVGLKLSEKFVKINQSTEEKPFNRVKKWILDNYGSLRNFVIINNLIYEDIYLILFEEAFSDLNFINILYKSGCNPDWIITGTGSQYTKNPMGELLQNQIVKELLLNKNQVQNNIKDNNLEKLIPYDDILKIINIAMLSNGNSNTNLEKENNDE